MVEKMTSLATTVGSTIGTELGSIAEFYLKSQFLEKAMQIDEYQDKLYEAEEETALATAQTEYASLAKTGKANFVKAALIPRTGSYNQSVSAIKFMFNPTELNISRQVNVTEMKGARTSQGLPKVSYGSIDPYQIELAGLLFDTYEKGTNVLTEIQTLRDAVDFTKFGTRKSYVDSSGNVDFMAMYSRGTYASLVDTSSIDTSSLATSTTSVVTGVTSSMTSLISTLGSGSTSEITSASDYSGLGTAFTEYDDLQDVPLVSKHPPVYYFMWGEQNYMTCMITKLSYKLTMFLPDGTPVRALVDVSLKEVDMRVASRKYSDVQNITS